MKRHAPIPALTMGTIPVYRCGGDDVPWRESVEEAYRDAATEDIRRVYGGRLNGTKRHFALRSRLARWLWWRDSRLAAMRETQ